MFPTCVSQEYLPQRGSEPFCNLAREALLGKNCIALKEKRVATVQSLSGTGALRIAAAFISRFMGKPLILISDPTWGNHLSIAGL
jgi:aspartate/tyrosine/aromatic aminotransferase